MLNAKETIAYFRDIIDIFSGYNREGKRVLLTLLARLQHPRSATNILAAR